MRNYLLLLILLFTYFFSEAQNSFDKLKYQSYYSISSLGKIVEIKAARDSLWITSGLENTSPENVPRVTKKGAKKGYEIVKDTIKGSYHLLIIKRSLPDIPSGRTIPKLPLYSLFAFYLSANNNLINVLQSDYDHYNTVEQAVKISFNVDFNKKLFVSWYSAPTMDSYLKFEDLKNVNQKIIKQLNQTWINEFNLSPKRLVNMNGWESEKFAQEFLTRSLIKMHLNPKVSMHDFSMILASNHIAIPNIRIGEKHEGKLFLDTNYKQPLKIDEPK